MAAPSSSQYRKLLANLPSMASVVNSFESPEVQLEVYRTLINSMQGGGAMSPESASSETPSSRAGNVDDNGVVAHDLIDGGNIHTLDD